MHHMLWAGLVLLATAPALPAHHVEFCRASFAAIEQKKLDSIQPLFSEAAWSGLEGGISASQLQAKLDRGELVPLKDAPSTLFLEYSGHHQGSYNQRCAVTFKLRFPRKPEAATEQIWLLAKQMKTEEPQPGTAEAWQIWRIVQTHREAEAFLGRSLPREDAELSKKLSLERIFEDEEFKAESFSAQWREPQAGYTYLPRERQDEIWSFRPGEEAPSVMVTADELTPVGSSTPLSIDDYAFSEDEALLLIFTNTKRVWRHHTRGDYWLLDRGSGELRKLGGEGPASSLMFAKISPAGDRVAYVRERNIYVEDLSDHTIKALTKTLSEGIINGTADWVYEEELGVRDGFRWSPDGRSIAYWQFDESEVRRQILVDHVSGLYPETKSFAYPKVGQQNPSCRIGVVPVEGGDTRWMRIPGDPRNHYLARMEWRDDSEALVIQQLNRAQNINRVLTADPREGSVRVLFQERDDAWVDVHDEMFWLPNREAHTWISERSGWRHLYLISGDGEVIRRLTPGAFDVIRLLRVDDSEQWAYFIASPENPAERYLYRVALDGGEVTRLTPRECDRGTHSYQIAPDGKHAIWTSSTLDDPPVTRLVSLPEHETLRVLEGNEDLRQKVGALERTPAEFFYVDLCGDVRLHARCLKPPNFDPEGSYPLLIHVYGEPAGQVVTDRWGGKTHIWHLMLAEQGYVVMSFDNRGTAAPRGRAWRKAAHRQIGILAPEEQAAAVRAVLKNRPYLDPQRVGSWGWSGGGSMSLNAIFKYPKLYKTAIAVASVPNQRYYDSIYQERYMGSPDENVDGYREGSPIHFAHQLEGDLLIVHGAADDNCHYQIFEKLVDVLVRHNKTFSMMTYPRGTHAIKEGKNTKLHLFGLMTRFLHRHLPVQCDPG